MLKTLKRPLTDYTTPELLKYALNERRINRYWQAFLEIERRGGDEIFEQAIRWCCGGKCNERQLGAHILGALSKSDMHYHTQSAPILIQLLDDPDPSVIVAAVLSLRTQEAPEIIPKLITLSHHPRVDLRKVVCFRLSCIDDPDEAVIDALLRLAKDRSPKIRTDATAGLSQVKGDNTLIRAILLKRIGDSSVAVWENAMIGLIRRGHPKVYAWSLAALQTPSDDLMTEHLNVASYLGDARLLPDLYRIKAICDVEVDEINPYFIRCLDDAIASILHQDEDDE